MSRAELGSWARELDDFVRALSGAYIFGVPLLFTMEVWWIGTYADLWKLLAFLGVAFAANLGLTHAVGFKRETTFGTTINQAVDAVAVGIVAAFVMLLVLNRITLSDPLDSVLGKVVVQAVPLSIGASVANEILGQRGEKSRQGQEGRRPGAWRAFFSDVGATIIGGIFIGFSIAPTQEVPMLAAGLEYPHVLALIGFSLMVSYAIVFASGFDQQRSEGLFQRPITETTLAYLIALLVALVTLYFFDRIEIGDPLPFVVEQTLVLGFPTAVGGAAGRLVI
ncbi:MAG TPA: TIGR02587 family membrane protein [Thermomicrobiales bacterium]|nr:TIGR02587 family membrane protein [Thermomicrobiales bacterium]